NEFLKIFFPVIYFFIPVVYSGCFQIDAAVLLYRHPTTAAAGSGTGTSGWLRRGRNHKHTFFALAPMAGKPQKMFKGITLRIACSKLCKQWRAHQRCSAYNANTFEDVNHYRSLNESF